MDYLSAYWQVIAGAFVVFILFIIVLREFWCWYFKINQLNRNITEFNSNSIKIIALIETIVRKLPENEVNYDSIIDLQNNKKSLIVKKGETGPGAGYVFYDKGQYTDGWRYLEFSNKPLEETYPWNIGYMEETKARDEKLGTGVKNTEKIILKHKDGKYAAAVAKKHSVNDIVDWYLPSTDEILILYAFIKEQNLLDYQNFTIWSATEANPSYAYAINMKNGEKEMLEKDRKALVLPIRSF